MAYVMMDGVRTDKDLEQERFLELLKGHEALMQEGIKSGKVLLAGPKVSSRGLCYSERQGHCGGGSFL